MNKIEKKVQFPNLSNKDFIEYVITQVSTNGSLPKYGIILSNPPYLAFHSRFIKKSLIKKEKKRLQSVLPVFSGKRDNTYLLFLGICLQYLLISNGVVGLVVDHSFLDLPSYKKIRYYLLSNYHLHYVLANYNYRKSAVVDLSLLVFSHQIESKKKTIWREDLSKKSQIIQTNHFMIEPNYMIRLRKIPNFLSQIEKKTIPLGDLVTITCGLEYGSLLKTHFLSKNKEINFYPVIDGSNGLPQPYFLFWVPGLKNSYVRFDKAFEKQLQNTNQNKSRKNTKVLLISGKLERFLTQKIILRQTATKFIASLDNSQYLSLRNTHLIYYPKPPYSLFFILGILNSSLGNWFGEYYNIIRKASHKSNRYPQIRINDLKLFPIIDINCLNDNSLVFNLEEKVKECLKTGKFITTILTDLWNISHTLESKIKTQKKFLRMCLNNNILSHFTMNEQIDKLKTLNNILQKRLSELSKQIKLVDSIVFRIYGISQKDQNQIISRD